MTDKRGGVPAEWLERQNERLFAEMNVPADEPMFGDGEDITFG
jgi:hypothetical protein